ncbi:hypothetical protein [Microcoleus sp. Pol12A6]|uniref:hypothetical protein n=1 Tax=Microcoleus sp. Pol12A6 TaxID=3055393 RepID=UPI002FD5B42B
MIDRAPSENAAPDINSASIRIVKSNQQSLVISHQSTVNNNSGATAIDMTATMGI